MQVNIQRITYSIELHKELDTIIEICSAGSTVRFCIEQNFSCSIWYDTGDAIGACSYCVEVVVS